MNTKKIGSTVYITETMQERFERYEEQEKTLKLLCAPLNVDDDLTDDDIEDMRTKIESQVKKITELESDLGDYKNELEAKGQGIVDVIEWLKTQRTDGIEADLINIDEVIAELKAVQIMRGE